MPRCHRIVHGFAIGSAVLLAAGLTTADEAAVEKHEGGVRVTLDGKPFTEYLLQNGPKPILWPIIGPGGHEMTRNFPLRKVDGEKRDHPHHRSLWFTHGSVNGIDFWSEPGAGKIVHREFLKCAASGPTAVISTINDWIGPGGKKQCEDVRTLTFQGDADRRLIDFDITIKASDGPVRFGDTKEGTMGVRIPTSMDLLQLAGKPPGEIVNSEGQKDKATWGKQAPWVDYHGLVDSELMGIAILNHPSSFRYPTYWHVRDYGLFAANPFGLHDFKGSQDKEEGAYTLPAGETLSLRYRFVFHRGDEKTGGVAEAFQAYAQEPR